MERMGKEDFRRQPRRADAGLFEELVALQKSRLNSHEKPLRPRMHANYCRRMVVEFDSTPSAVMISGKSVTLPRVFNGKGPTFTWSNPSVSDWGANSTGTDTAPRVADTLVARRMPVPKSRR